MNNYIRDYEERQISSEKVVEQSTFAILMRKVYVWMALALVVSGLTAYYVAGSEQMLMAIFGNQITFWVLAIAEFGLVIGLTAALKKLSFPVAAIMVLLFSILNGVTLSAIFVVYTMSSIATTFFVTAGTFAAMAFIGYTTKKDLTKIGGILLMALIGLIIASVVNIFLKNSMMDIVISAIGVLIFVGLTAYDAQKIKEMMLDCGTEVNDFTQKLAVFGALSLYLDFINLFLYLLRFLGKQRS
ncbi:MAG: Bax inhibitor-1/YccA family protein [Bacteroidaceae bacterium]|nr:Bax inhibitor-1/YccA family protein [Bacteroidaceae bacterium]